MEEEDCDYGTPVGQIIKQINLLCKKPAFDHQLSEAIDLFHEKLNEGEKYLANGIFNLNFAESALFLQSCTELYGKKIDLLWNHLLEFHTRLIKYEYEHEKQKGGPINKEAIAKLEERRNRYLRKKNFKLIQEEEEISRPKPLPNPKVQIDTDYLIEENGKLHTEEDLLIEQDEVDVAVTAWARIEAEVKERLKVPYPVYELMTEPFRLKNYPILKSTDFDIIDVYDGEFNTKYSRVPGWHHIAHLMEYNEKGLLPDQNNIIAKLKLNMYGKMMFLESRNLPFNTPYDQYKKDYKEYCDEFIKEEGKRWQNMPVNNLEDYRKQIEYVTRLYQSNNNIKSCSIKDNKEDDKIEIGDTSDEDSLFEYNREYLQADLFERMQKISCDLVNTKLRQDSGVYDCNSENGNDNSLTPESVEESSMADANLNIRDVNANINKDNNVDVIQDNAEICALNNTEVNGDKTTNPDDNNVNTEVNNVDIANDSDKTDNPNTEDTCDKGDDDNFDARSVASDHDYCLPQPNVLEVSVDKKGDKNEVLNKTVEEVFKVPLLRAKIIPKIEKTRELGKKHQINREHDNDDCPRKRRKLSQRQIELLLQSKVPPIKVLKFEKFFSENYTPEDGEGVVPVVEYNSEDSETEDVDSPVAEADNCQDNDDVRSILSDHSYCQPLPEVARQDSGFLELPIQPSKTSEQISLEQEYEKLLANVLQRQSQEPQPPTTAAEVIRLAKEKERKDLRARVDEWRNTINPILMNLKEKDFDIHEYGSRMIEDMEVNETKPFNNIVQGKTSAEVVRYFISSLQLANTNNIEICGVKQGQLSNDTYSIKLLSKDRYHEHLREYLAPSEESFAEKLQRVRAMDAAEKDTPKKLKPRELNLKEKRPKGNALITKNLVIKINKPPPNILSSQVSQCTESTHSTYQHNKENHSTDTPSSPNRTAKGKSIIKHQASTPQVLNYDISVPSTSRQVHWSETPSQTCLYDPRLPSTSSKHSESFNSAPRVYGSSPSRKRRSDSTEEAFIESLMAAQKLNPGVQVHSTPEKQTQVKYVKISAGSMKSILF